MGGYRLIKQIGRGGMGIVFLAEYLSLNRLCALKFLAPSLVSNRSWIMFQNEAKIVAGLYHPTICQIYDMGVHDGRLPFYAMEYLEGESLESILLTQRTLTVGAALEVFSKVAAGLSYAHRHGVVHKDIKPANIMLTATADGQVAVKILDFGIAELIDGQNIKEKTPADVIGSAFYMSPEQLMGTKLDQRSDIYSVGCSLFETLTGEPPFLDESKEALTERHCNDDAPTLKERTNIEFPEELEVILKRTLAKAPEARYQSAEQLGDDIEQLLLNKPLFQSEPTLQNAGSTARNTPTPPPLAGYWGVVVVLLATGAFLALSYLAVSLMVNFTSNEPPPGRKPLPNKASVREKETDSNGNLQSANDTSFTSNLEKKYFNEIHNTAERYTAAAIKASGFIKTGVGLSEIDEPAQSIKIIKKGLSIDPQLWTSRISDTLVKDYIDLGQFENALNEANKGIQKEPTHYRYRCKGQILCQLNRNKEAIKAFDTAAKLGPKEYWNYFDRGNCYLMLDQNERALADFTKLISMRPHEARGYSLRAQCYERLGKHELAAIDMKECARIGREEVD